MNAEDDVDDPLLPLAEKIAEGTTVDPDEEHERAHQDSNRDALNALLDIAAIGAAHRGPSALSIGCSLTHSTCRGSGPI